jgi:hypothetical protein
MHFFFSFCRIRLSFVSHTEGRSQAEDVKEGAEKDIRPKRDEITGDWRRLHNKELYAVYSLLNIIWLIKSTEIRWTGHVARMGDRR